MKKFLSLVLVSVGCTSVFLSSSANAVNRPHTLTFSAGGGYYYFANKRHIDNTGMPFVIAGYNFTENWGIEGFFSRFHTDTDHPVDRDRGVRRVRTNLFAINGVYHFCPFCNIQPYVLAGYGAVSLNPNGTDAHDEGGINGAVGAQYFVWPSVALRVEARDFYTIVGGKNEVFLNAGISFLLDVCAPKMCC